MLTIYKASAGSGKTFTLAYEYIKTLLGIKLHNEGTYVLNSDKYAPGGHRLPNRHRNILAITFTNAATEEMKRRIVKQLDALTDPSKESDYRKKLIDTFGCTPDELQAEAAKALGEVLNDYSAFSVSTIDSFFQSVLRTFAREIDHQGDYELMIDQKAAVRAAVSLMLDELNFGNNPHESQLTKWLHRYVLEKVGDGNSYNVFQREGKLLADLTAKVDKAIDEVFLARADELDAYLADPKNIAAFRNELKQRIDHAYDKARDLAKQLNDLKADRGFDAEVYGNMQSRIDAALAAKPSFASKDLQMAIFKPGFDFNNGRSRSSVLKLKPDHPDFNMVAGMEQDFATELKKAYTIQKIWAPILQSLDFLEFMGFARRTLIDYMRDTNRVLISDTGELLKRIISEAEMPFIYERMGLSLTNLLIDEFQDTSRVQWHNLRPLVANSIASGHDNLIIGDEKQAIYRFRNSDSELLGSQVQADPAFRASHVLRGQCEAENTNYRSAADIVRFNNSLFATLAPRLGATHYGNVRQGVHRTTLPAYIKLHFHTEKNDEINAAILESMAQDILRQHSQGYRWKDIMVLARTNTELRNIVDFLLREHPEIQVLSSEALLLRNSPAVRTIISMLKLVSRSYEGRKNTRGDDAAMYASRGDVEMMITRFNHYESRGVDPEKALEEALREGTVASAQLSGVVDDIRRQNPANIAALVESVIALRLSPEERLSEYAYIAALQDLVLKHLDGVDTSLATFLAEYDRNQDRWAIKAPASLDAVQLMTVHRSKGLERDCIHIPFAAWELNHNTTSLWVTTEGFTDFKAPVPPLLNIEASASSPLCDPVLSPVAKAIESDMMAERIDNLNACYVAFTRAARELIVHSHTAGIGAEIMACIDVAIGDSGMKFKQEIVETPKAPKISIKGEATEQAPAVDTYYIYGEPTLPVSTPEIAVARGIKAGEYTVNFRSDTREFVSIDDAMAVNLDDDDMGDSDTPPKKIVEPVSPDSTPQMVEAARRGTLLHAILSEMTLMTDLGTAVHNIAVRQRIPSEEEAEFRADLAAAFDAGGQQTAEWFSPRNKILAERSIYDNKTGYSYRPDRVVVSPDGKATIVDYKFTSRPDDDHFSQVREYMTLFRRMGYEKVEGFLWYPLLNEILEVS